MLEPEGGDKCCDTRSSGHDLATTLMISQHLESLQKTYISSSQSKFHKDGVDDLWTPPFTEKPLGVDSC